MKIKTRLLILVTILITSVSIINASTICVDRNASGANNGSSWTDAYTSLQSALDAAVSSDEIWVAKGTYLPTTKTEGTTDRHKAFQMKNGVAIYGGFEGIESAVSGRTDYGFGETNNTILSGDFNDDDVITGSGSTLAITGNSENAYHIFHHLSTSGLTTTAILDGFTIVGGNANGAANPWTDGGAIYNRSNQTPTINNCYFTGNSAIDNGGAIMNIISAHAIITNCTFVSNYAEESGGAIGNYNATNAIITNCLFSGNRANIGNGGGLWNYDNSNPTVTNCTFTKNSAKSGGGVYNSVDSDIIMVNSIVYGNTITEGWGTQIRNYTDSDLTLSYSDIEAGGINNGDGGTTTDGGGNIESNPLFVGSGDYPYLIFGESPCVDVGYNDATTETTDIRGGTYERKLNKTDGLAGTIDMGAYEYKFGIDPLPGEITWTGSQDSDWNTAANWNNNTLPTATDDVIITNAGAAPIISTEANCNNLTVSSGILTIESTSATNTGSLIINGDASGNVTVQRFLTKDVWHYISGQTEIIDNFTTAMTGLAPGSGNDQFYRWDEAKLTDDTPGTWVDILNGPTGNGSNTEMNQTFVACRGYAVTYKNNDKTLSLSGVPYTVNKVINITNTPNGTNPGANLVGNPFTSTIAINNDAQTENFIVQNASVLAATKQAIYLWDESQDDYKSISNITDATYIAPGQGFMIVAKNASEDLEFNENIRKHGAATFYKNTNDNDVPRMELSIKDSENRRNTTTISFLPNMRLGLDPSYDAGKLKGNPNIALYTRLVEDNGVDFALQALPDNDIESIVIPVGVDVANATIIEFSITHEAMEQYTVYLQDRQENTSTNIMNNTYSTLVSESGVGRFYLHFSPLSVDEPTTASQLIKTWAANNIVKIYNKHNLSGDVKVINTFGQIILNTKLNGDINQQITVNSQSGIYIVNITTNKGIVNKKVYLK